MAPEGPADPHPRLPAAELDDVVQTLYGVAVSLNAHVRRSHRPGSQPAQEVLWAVEQLTAVQRRLTRFNHPA